MEPNRLIVHLIWLLFSALTNTRYAGNKTKFISPTQLCIVNSARKILPSPCRWLTYTLKHEILLSLNHNLGSQSCKLYVNIIKWSTPFWNSDSIRLNSLPWHEFYKLLHSVKRNNFFCFEFTVLWLNWALWFFTIGHGNRELS